MGRFKIGALITALAAVGVLVIPTSASADDTFECFACPPELAGLTFPEPRVFIETQGWWVQGRNDLAEPDVSGDLLSDFAFTSNHVHLGIPFPVGEQFVLPPGGEGYSWPYLAQWHENAGGSVRSVRGGGFQVADPIPTDPDYKSIPITDTNLRHAGAISVPPSVVDKWRSFSGKHENRFTADTTSKQGKRQYQSGAWNALFSVPGQPVAVTARGWYEGPGYTNVTLKTPVRASTLASTGLPSSLSYGLDQGASFAFAYIDADIHHGSKGIVLFENRKGSPQSFALPVLSPGVHVLLLGGWEKAASGWNAGVLRIPFNVPEVPVG